MYDRCSLATLSLHANHHQLDIIRVAELRSLSSGAKMAMKILVKRVFTIIASNASLLRVIANFAKLIQ